MSHVIIIYSSGLLLIYFYHIPSSWQMNYLPGKSHQEEGRCHQIQKDSQFPIQFRGCREEQKMQELVPALSTSPAAQPTGTVTPIGRAKWNDGDGQNMPAGLASSESSQIPSSILPSYLMLVDKQKDKSFL